MKLLGASGKGTGLWLAQRYSAVVLALGTPVLLALAFSHADYTAWRALFLPPWAKALWLLYLAALLLHAWVGLNHIILDYVHAYAGKLAAHALATALLAGCLFWGAYILWGVA